jgi:hypothetical protein
LRLPATSSKGHSPRAIVHAPAKTRAIFDDDHVIAYGGLASAMRLAERCDLGGLVG